MSQPDAADSNMSTISEELSCELPTEEEYKILNGKGGVLDQYAEAMNAINYVELANHGWRLGWTVKEKNGDAVVAPCIKDANDNIVEHKMLKRQYPGQSNTMTIIWPFFTAGWAVLTPSKMAESSARLDGMPPESATLKETARQEISMRGAASADGDGTLALMDKVYGEWYHFYTYEVAKTLIESKHPDFSQFKGSIEALAEKIVDQQWSGIYPYIKPPKIITDDDGNQREIKEMTCRTNMFQNRKQSPSNMDPKLAAPHEFAAYSERDRELVTTVLENAKGNRMFTPMQITMDNGKPGSSATLNNHFIAALVMGIGNLNFKQSKGGGVFVRKGINLIVYRNGPSKTSDAPKLNAASFVADMLAKNKRSREEEPIKESGRPEKQSKTSRFQDAKKRLEARKRALKKERAQDDSE